MLAGRKLLLADDSATIQKVIDLTFADEGVRVLAVSNGQEAIEQLLDFAPDIVLADVHMPAANGYEVCEYVKTNETLKHIPVVLLVGSFEPFDETEARRVGADDILTKPFSSIRRLIDRVGALVSSPPVEKEAATAELPKPEGEPAEEPQLSTQELELTTADTLPLEGHPFADSLPRVEPVVSESKPAESVTPSARLEAVLSEMQSSETPAEVTSEHEGSMEPGNTETHMGESQPEAGDVLLDLGEMETTRAAASDDFVLDLDDDLESSPVYNAAPAYEPAPAYESTAYEATPAYEPAPAYEATPAYEPEPSYEPTPMRAFVEPEVTEAAQTYEAVSVPPELTPDPVPVFGESEFPTADTHQAAAPVTSDRAVNLDQLSPEMIDAIARRAVELMSDKVIREIAWEVVPDLAELLIKRQLEERSAK
ncbi:MAG TPA: response regulator [Pyrinomonadaceae bacterium]|nr:response regulator [Pyrinomonadaceae bacterium]